jgi:hypothetical protein
LIIGFGVAKVFNLADSGKRVLHLTRGIGPGQSANPLGAMPGWLRRSLI